MAEQLTCNQQVVGSTPITSSNVEDFPSGQRGQTVNLLAYAYDGSNPSLSTSETFAYANIAERKDIRLSSKLS